MNSGQELPPPGIWKADGTRLSNADGRGEEPPSLVAVGRSDKAFETFDASASSIPLSPFTADEGVSLSLTLLLILNSGIPSVAGMDTAAATAGSVSSRAEKNVAFSRDASVFTFGARPSFSATTRLLNVAATAKMARGRVILGSVRLFLCMDFRCTDTELALDSEDAGAATFASVS